MAKIYNENKGNESIPRNLIFDTSLSDRARFVYCYMCAKPDGWDFILAPMAKELGYGVETLRKYITELVESGWIVKGEQGYDKTTGKFLNVDYTIKNRPSPCRKKTVTVKTRDGKNHAQYINSSINTPLNEDNKEKKYISKDIHEKDSVKRFRKPTIEDIDNYISEKGLHFNAEDFFDYYESKGWVIGKSPMKDWKAACRTWERNRKQQKKEDKEEPTEETTCAMDPKEWLGIVAWMQEKAYKIASEITSKMFVKMKAKAGDSNLLADILIEIGHLAEYHKVDVMTEFERILKEKKQ